MDRKRIIGEVAAKHGVLLAEDDPAFLLVTIADQEEAAERMQKSIGETLGNSIRRALSEGGGVVPPRPVHLRWRVVFFGALFGLLLFAAGFAIGAMWK